MDKKVSITIEYSEAMYLERLYFEYMASLNILRYLTSQDGTKEEYLDRYRLNALLNSGWAGTLNTSMKNITANGGRISRKKKKGLTI